MSIDANFEVIPQTPYFFTDSASNDFIIYVSSNSQHILLGMDSNAASVMNLSTSNLKINKPTYIGSVIAAQGAHLEIADPQNNQFILYNNSNNRKGLFMNTLYGIARIGGQDWTHNTSLNMSLQDSGGYLGIGSSNPLGFVHLANNTNCNNIIIESGFTSEGANSGFSAINFNGYTSNSPVRIDSGKNRWRMYVNQNTTKDHFCIDSYDGTNTYKYLALSNNNIGINNSGPISRLHIVGGTSNGTNDQTNSSNCPVTFEDHSGNAMRLLHISSNSLDSTIYNYETGKNVYWGESTDVGVYNFRGRFVSIQNYLGIGTISPLSLIQMTSDASNFVSYTNTSNTQGFIVGIDNINVSSINTSNKVGAFVWNNSNAHIRFGTNNVERMRLQGTGSLLLGAADILNPVGGLLEISSSSNQFIIYNNSNNKVGLYIGNSNVSRIGAYDWTNDQAMNLVLQDSGSNLGIGSGSLNPLSLLHLRNGTSCNNILLEAGYTSDGQNQGFSAINFNGYYDNGDQIINYGKQRWRLYVNQETSNDFMNIDAYNGAVNHSYITMSNNNVGINKMNPNGRLHVLGASVVGGVDGTGTSNNSLTLEDSSGAIRVIHLSSHVSDSAYYNFQTGKNVYFGEFADVGMYYFRGRFMSIASNLGINTTTPSQRLEVNGNMMFTSAASIFSGNTLTLQPNAGNIVMNTNSASGNIIFQLSGQEQARLLNSGSLAIGSNNVPTGVMLYTFSNTAGPLIARIENSNNGNSSYASVNLVNDSGNACSLFLNSSTRSTDGSADVATLRNNAGDLRLAAANTMPYIYLQSYTNKVGINTTSPGSTLEVNGSCKFDGPTSLITNTWHLSTDNVTRLYYGNNASTLFGTGGGYVWNSSGNSQSNMILTDNGSLYVPYGTCGIGTSNPAYALDVVGDIRSSGTVHAGTTISLDAYNSGLYMSDATWVRVTNDKSIYTGGNLSINGNFGINNTSPSYPLHVSKTMTSSPGQYNYFNGCNSGPPNNQGYTTNSLNVSIGCTGSILATDMNAYSDRRIKKNIRKYEESKSILNLKVMNFEYINGLSHGSKTKIGLIAQDVEAVIPNVVSHTTEFIPDILQMVNVLEQTEKAIRIRRHDLKVSVGDVLQCCCPAIDNLILTVKDITDDRLELESSSGFDGNPVLTDLFIVGRRVTDFRVIDFEQMTCYLVKKMQDMYKSNIELENRLKTIEEALVKLTKSS